MFVGDCLIHDLIQATIISKVKLSWRFCISEPRCCRQQPAATSPEHPWRLNSALFSSTERNLHPRSRQNCSRKPLDSLTVSSDAGWEPLSLKTMAQDSIWAEPYQIYCGNMEMSLVLVCVITKIAVMMIMHPFCLGIKEETNWCKCMYFCLAWSHFGQIFRFYQEMLPGYSLIIVFHLMHIKERLWNVPSEIDCACFSRYFPSELYLKFHYKAVRKKKKGLFLLLQWHQNGQTSQHCWRVALVLLATTSFIFRKLRLILWGPKFTLLKEELRVKHQFNVSSTVWLVYINLLLHQR